jgi:hypothetical protein
LVYRKGEPSKSQIDRGWPYQVALRADRCIGEQYKVIHDFCKDLSLCSRGHFFWRDDVGFNVFCFAVKEDAEKFYERFGGEMFKADERRGRRIR